MLCPYNCAPCHQIDCRYEGCRLTGREGEASMTMAGEMRLMPCEECGTLIVLHIEHVRCGPCLTVTVGIPDPDGGEAGRY